MAALFGHGNPLTTQVGQLIERSTDGSQASENWGLFMEVCDIINETDEGPKDAIKAIRKRLSQNVGKNYTAVLYTLTCLETCVKNCGKRFHILVANKDFLHDLIKIIGPKNDPPQAVQEKVLNLIQTWADAFRGTQELKDVEKVYQELRSKGIEFPMTDLDNFAPIHTPARSVPESETISTNRSGSTRAAAYMVADDTQEGSVRNPYTGGQVPAPVPLPVEDIPPEPVTPTADQQTKLRRELDLVSGNVRVMSEMLTELTPTSVDPSDLELLQELHRTCRQMQQRVVELLNHIANEEVTNELLRVNDELNNVFLRYERFERYRTGQAGVTEQTSPPISQPPPLPPQDHLPPSYDQAVGPGSGGDRIPASNNPNVGNLIDFGDEPSTDTTAPKPIHEQLAAMNVNASSVSRTLGTISQTRANTGDATRQTDDFDMFAQSRQSFDQTLQEPSSGAYQNQQEDQFHGGLGQAVNTKAQGEVLKLQDKETDYDEMEQWLASHKASMQAGNPESITSSEFDNFLAERAAAAEQLPSISAATGQQQPRAAPRSNRQLKKDDEDNALFAL